MPDPPPVTTAMCRSSSPAIFHSPFSIPPWMARSGWLACEQRSIRPDTLQHLQYGPARAKAVTHRDQAVQRGAAPPKPFDRGETPCHVFTYWGTAESATPSVTRPSRSTRGPNNCAVEHRRSEGAEGRALLRVRDGQRGRNARCQNLC